MLEGTSVREAKKFATWICPHVLTIPLAWSNPGSGLGTWKI